MKKYVIKKAILSLWFCFISLMLVSITFPYMEMSATASFVLYDLLYLLVISFICFALPMVGQIAVQLILMVLELLVLNASISVYASSSNIFNWTMITLIKEAKISSGMAVIPIMPIVACVSAVSTYIMFAIFLKSEKVKLKNFYTKLLFCTEAVVITFSALITVDYRKAFVENYDEENYYSSDSFMYATFSSSYASLQKFGYYGYYFEDLARKFFPSLAPVVKPVADYKYNYYTSILDSVAKDNNVVMIYAESFDMYAISPELTPVLYALKNGIDLTECGVKNFYDALNEDGEISFVRRDLYYDDTTQKFVETGVDIYAGLELDKVGLTLENYKSSESTNYSELKSLEGGLWFSDYSLPKMLSNYSTNYVHGNLGEFYEREKYMVDAVGFKTTQFLDDMDFAVGSKNNLNCLTLDSVTMKHYTSGKASVDIFPTDQRFFTYFMTITTHGDYSKSEFLEENYKFVEALKTSSIVGENFKLLNSLESEDLKNAVTEYYARVLDTEYAMCYIVNYLHQNNLLDKTIITFTGDHNAYSNNVGEFKKQYVQNCLGKDPYVYENIIEGFIYSTQVKAEYLEYFGESRRVPELAQPIDLAPTILTMLGVDFSQEAYLGSAVINLLAVDNTKRNGNKVMYSYYYGFMEGDKLITTDGENISALNPNYTPTAEEISEFKKYYNDFFTKKYYIVDNLSGG